MSGKENRRRQETHHKAVSNRSIHANNPNQPPGHQPISPDGQPVPLAQKLVSHSQQPNYHVAESEHHGVEDAPTMTIAPLRPSTQREYANHDIADQPTLLSTPQSAFEVSNANNAARGAQRQGHYGSGVAHGNMTRARGKGKPLPTFGGGLRGWLLGHTGYGVLSKRARASLPATEIRRLLRRAISTSLLLVLLVTLLASTADALQQGLQMKHEASDAISHIQNIQALIPASKGGLSAALNTATLQKIQVELTAAEHDFAALRSQLGAPTGTLLLADHAPVAGSTIDASRALVSAADEASLAGLDLLKSSDTLLGVLKGGLFASGSPTPGATATATNATNPVPGATPTPATPAPTLNAQGLAQLSNNYNDAIAHLDNAVAYASTADLSALPSIFVKPKYIEMIQKALASWPQTHITLVTIQQWLTIAPELLGVTTPENFLLEMMDRSELRPGGGFIGNYAIMTIAGGKIQPFKLADTYFIDTPFRQSVNYPVPSVYPWWPYPGWGLRDSNISADFPTAAQAAMMLLPLEGQPRVQGVVAFTPAAIARIITVVGTLTISGSGCDAKVTPQNLEATIHYWQQIEGDDPNGHPDPNRKHCTSLLGQVLMSKLHGLPAGEMYNLIKQSVTSLHTKDIQIYFANQKAEALLTQMGFSDTLMRNQGDSVAAIDANIGNNKANLYVSTTYTDNVTIDASGTATHHLTITYNFVPTSQVLLFGFDRYYAYVRVYTPQNAQLASYDGFDTLAGAPQINTSDEPRLQMWGGYIYVPDRVPVSLHFTWSVPHAATQDAFGKWRYSLDFQNQAGATESLVLTITTPGASKPAVSYKGILDTDLIYSITY